MPKESVNRIGSKIDEFGKRYRLWFVIPLLIACATAFWNLKAALGFVIVMLCIWVFLGAVALVVWACRTCYPN